ncbi:MAG: fimbrillin family protein [Candidatus Cryptobacteroides sp.]
MQRFAFIPSALAFISIVAGCDVTIAPKEESPIPIKISTTLTKVSGDSFEENDAIGLFVVNASKSDESWVSGELMGSGNHVNNAKYTYSQTWETTGEYYWKDSQTPADFYCYHPYKEELGDDIEAVSFTIPTDQGTAEAFKSAEILWGKANLQTPTENRVVITTSHRTSQIAVELVPGKGFTEETLAESITSITINNIKSGASLNLKDGNLTADGEASDITPYKDGKIWRALIAPQKIVETKLVTIVVDGQERSLVQTVDFSSNSIKKCTITVNKINEGINVGIGGWEEDGNDYGGTLN